MSPLILAHGGTAGAAIEAGILLVPVIVFWLLLRWGKRQKSAADKKDNGA